MFFIYTLNEKTRCFILKSKSLFILKTGTLFKTEIKHFGLIFYFLKCLFHGFLFLKKDSVQEARVTILSTK